MVMIPPQEWQNISDETQHERWTDIRVVMNHCSCLGSRLYQAVTSDLLGDALCCAAAGMLLCMQPSTLVCCHSFAVAGRELQPALRWLIASKV